MEVQCCLPTTLEDCTQRRLDYSCSAIVRERLIQGDRVEPTQRELRLRDIVHSSEKGERLLKVLA